MSDVIKRAHEVGFHRAALEHGATITDRPIPNFSEGWAHQPNFKRGRLVAHYWTKHYDARIEAQMVAEFGEQARGIAELSSACGLSRHTTSRVPVLGPGNLPYCARCENALMRKMRNT